VPRFSITKKFARLLIAQIRNNRRVKKNWDDRAGKNQPALRSSGLGSVSMARDAW